MIDKHDNFFQEIEEDIRLEKLEKFWKRYQNHIIGGVVGIAIVVSGILYWNHWHKQSRTELSQQYTDALTKIAKGDQEAAFAILDTLKGDKGYGPLAMLTKAATLAKNPKTLPEALKVYQEIANNTSYDKKIALLAALTEALNQLDTGDVDVLRQNLEKLNTPDNPWQSLVIELQAALEHKAGNTAKAKELYQQLADDANASQASRARALAIVSDYN